MADGKPVKRVAIVGGGYAALAAAFELTHERNNKECRYEVTIYTQGWRLGGKAASSRRIFPKFGIARIEERSPHLWMGFYENAFRMLRECYEEWTGHADAWREAFDTATITAVPMGSALEYSKLWKFDLAAADGLPGDSETDMPKRTVGDYISMFWAFWKMALQSVEVIPREDPSRPWRPSVVGTLESALDFARLGEPLGLGSLVQGVEWMRVLPLWLDFGSEARILGIQEMLAKKLRGWLEVYLRGNEDRRRIWELVDCSLALTRGLMQASVTGLKRADKYDCRDWLKMNGAAQASTQNPFMNGLYSMAMGYAEGNPKTPAMAAGQGAYGFVRACTYRGDYLWQFARGPGEDVFVPLYKVLQKRGVKFRFFHRLRNVGVSGDRPCHVTKLEFDVQAAIEGNREYKPLNGEGQSAYWPCEPQWQQLVNGEQLRNSKSDLESHFDKTRCGGLTCDDDFDYVVLGVGLNAIGEVCKEILLRDAAWNDMVGNCKSVSTQSFQLWLRAPLKDVGFSGPPVAVSGLQDSSFDCCVDMRHRLRAETWPDDLRPHSLAYFRGMVNQNTASRLQSSCAVEEQAASFLNEKVRVLWPDAANRSGEFRWDLAVKGKKSSLSLHCHTNTDPSYQAAQILPDTVKYRLRPEDDSYPNLRVCGDWTDPGFNSPSAESAVMSGRLAAYSIIGRSFEEIPGYTATHGWLFNGMVPRDSAN